MVKLMLLSSGILLLLLEFFVFPVPEKIQFLFFITGILTLGVPHGAADLMVAMQNSKAENKPFSKIYFFSNYLGRLFLFGAILIFIPMLGNILFMLFAAWHFGETDLKEFKNDTISGKLFVISYGLVILGVILLNHFNEVIPLLQYFDAGMKYQSSLYFIDENRYSILTLLVAFFFIATFLYFFTSNTTINLQGEFLLQFAFLIIILFKLPMLLGFTFYFVVWHSVLSLKNIIRYLQKGSNLSFVVIAKQIGLYSFLATIGFSLFGMTGFMFANKDTLVVYVFLGLAVLTAPHMQIIHDMYHRIRLKQETVK
jgi:Brp/Blh family beta-carotene 15,15'-monooxygenase